jgi:hypothetical protein
MAYHAQRDGICSRPRLILHEKSWNGESHCYNNQQSVDGVDRRLDTRIEEAHC